jgi:hypothetical protein
VAVDIVHRGLEVARAAPMEVAEQRLPVDDPLRGAARDLMPEQPEPPVARVAEQEAAAVRKPQHEVRRGVIEALASEQLVKGRKVAGRGRRRCDESPGRSP